MAAYVLVDLEVTDPVVYEEYRKVVPSSIAKYGGRFVVRGGQFEVREGDWQPRSLVILEFPSYEEARRWYDSEEYAPQLEMRLKSSTANLLIVEGV